MSRPRPLTPAELKRHPLPPVEEGDKHDHGNLLIIGGSRGLYGATLLAAVAAMRAGTGRLRIATVEAAAPQLGIAMPEAMVVGLAEARDGGFARSAIDEIIELADAADAIVAGPGMMLCKTGERLAAAL